MHATLVKIQRKLTELINQLQSAIPNDEPFGPAHGNSRVRHQSASSGLDRPVPVI